MARLSVAVNAHRAEPGASEMADLTVIGALVELHGGAGTIEYEPAARRTRSELGHNSQTSKTVAPARPDFLCLSHQC